MCVFLWFHLEGLLPEGAEPNHTLWALPFLKFYEVEEGTASRLQADEKTCRKWTKVFVLAISNLKLVCTCLFVFPRYPNSLLLIYWSDRSEDNSIGGCCCSVHGTDCPINEPSPYSRAWNSRLINSAGLRYEIAVSVEKAKTVSVNGPWPTGTYNDLKIFRNGIRKNLLPDELVIEDRGYSDSRCIQPPGNYHPRNRIYTKIRSRHEILNKRLKHFGVLNQRFRHKISFHGVCFRAVSNITVMALKEKLLFSIF